MEPCIAHKVRQWLVSETQKRGEFSFTSNEMIEASGFRDGPTTATLSKMRKQGFLGVDGKRRRKGARGQPEIQYRITPQLARAIADIPVRKEPEPHTKSFLLHAHKAHALETFPIIAPMFVDELLLIAIALEENGTNRALGLRLLKLATRIFESATQ